MQLTFIKGGFWEVRSEASPDVPTRQRQEPNWAAREALGDNVRAARARAGMSQEYLAHESGVARSYVSTIERGLANLALDRIVLLAATLGVDATELVPTRRQVAAAAGRSSTR